MSQEKNANTEIIQNEGGSVVFAPEVVATIAGIAAAEVEGIASMTTNVVEGFTELFGKKNLTKGVKVDINEGTAGINLSVTVMYGIKMHEVCKQVQAAVKSAIETMTGLIVTKVDVFVQAVEMPKAETAPEIEAQ
ncbi:MAG: Asp23/Gls24 family envelope stress response protein [Clostridia bacterium]|nr:Asp23/Gls24 family envelope stress response protein [Clostridia bacterium]